MIDGREARTGSWSPPHLARVPCHDGVPTVVEVDASPVAAASASTAIVDR